MYTLIIISLIFLGLVFGSFGSVIFYRLGYWPTKETWKGFLVGRSECPHCQHVLKFRNLIPIFSYLFQGGKCEYCKAPISCFYPFLEVSTVCIFLVIFFVLSKYGIQNYHIGLGEGYIFTIFIMICAWLLWLILLYDIKTYELHITATMFLAVLSLFFTLFFGINKLDILLGILIFALIFLIIYYSSILYVKKVYKKDGEGFGFGDVIIAPILGAWLVFFLQPSGFFQRVYLVCLFIIVSCCVGLFYFGIEILLNYLKNSKKIKSKKSPYPGKNLIPFLPSMVIGFLLEIVLWEQFINLLYF